jgi:hypothetical protein
MVECGKIEPYKQEIEKRAKQDLVKKLKQINLFFQENLFACSML